MQLITQCLAAAIMLTLLGGCSGSGGRDGGGDKATSAQSGQLHGTVNYRQRIAMPPGAVVTVKLVDVTKADAAPEVLGEQTITKPGQVPVAFVIKYDAAKIVAGHRYEAQARIEIDGKLRWINTTATPVLQAGAPTDHVEVWVDMVSDR